MEIWITSDTHFGHKKLVEEHVRPEGFEVLIFKNFKYALNKNAILIHLGDVSFYRHAIWHRMICGFPCKKLLVRGNHDSMSISWYLSHGWDSVTDAITLDAYGHRILFSHKPTHGDYTLNIHGHLHGGPNRQDKTNANQILISQELNGYNPVNLRRLVEKFNRENCKDKQ